MTFPTADQLALFLEGEKRACDERWFHPVAARILGQAIAHGPCCPRQASIHRLEYDALERHVRTKDALMRSLESGLRRTVRSMFPGPTVLQLWNGHDVITLHPADDVPLGAIRWEPS